MRCWCLLCLVLCAACSNPPAIQQGGAETSAATTTTGPQRVTGTVPPPEGGFPSIVILESTIAGEVPARQASVPFMDQIQQTFLPSILFVRTGQPVEFRNNDEVLHNVRVQDVATKSPAFNVSIPTGETFTFVFPHDGFYDVGCDIHPAMASQIVASSSPYATTGDHQGKFVIDDVPQGAYNASIYSGPRVIERTITVDGGKAPFDFTKP